MSDADSRPRPQYGEYATPEEQQARISRPDATDALSSGEAAAAAPRPAASRPAASETGRRRTLDRVVTIGLLVYGLFNVVATAPRLLDFTTFANDYLSLMGVDAEFTNYAAAQLWGPIAAVSYAVGWLVTAAVSWRQLRRGRLAFWMPLVGAVLTTALVALCLTVPLIGDAALFGTLMDLPSRS